MATHSSILPGEFHRQRSLGVYSPWGCKVLDPTERLTHTTRVYRVLVTAHLVTFTITIRVKFTGDDSHFCSH